MIIRVGTTGDYPPFTQLNPRTEALSGFDITTIRQFAQDHQYDIDFVLTYWPTLHDDLAQHQFDIAVGGIHLTEQRQQKFLTTNPIIEDGKVLLTHQNNVGRFSSLNLEQLNNNEFKAIYNPGGTNEQFALSNLSNATLIREPKMENIFLRLLSKDVDFFITDKFEAIYRQQMFKHELRALNPDHPFTQVSMGYLIHKDRADLQKQLNQWLDNHKIQEP